MSEAVEVPGFRPDQLAGFRIAVTSDRRSGDLIDALERRGAQVMHAPTLRIANADHDAPVIADTRAIIEERPDALLATTAYGIRRWFEVADAAGYGDQLSAALESTAILVRGPKARGGIRAAGLNDVGMSPLETTESLVDMLLANYPPGLTVAVQAHGFLDPAQLERLETVHDRVLTVSPYSWTPPEAKDDRVRRLIEALCSGALDAVTFTSAPAVNALFHAAEAMGLADETIAALSGTVVAAAVGPVTAAPLLAAGIMPIQPERYRMGALIRLLCEHLETSAILRISTRYGPLEMRGHLVELAGRRVSLAPGSLALLRALVRAGGSVLSREALAASLPGSPDEHALEVALSRLRQALPEPAVVRTVVKRGYRIEL